MKEDTLSLIENRLKEYELSLDANKYFVVKDKQGKEVRTKPLTANEIENLRKRLDKVKSLLKEAWEDFYVDVILSPPAIQVL